MLIVRRMAPQHLRSKPQPPGFFNKAASDQARLGAVNRDGPIDPAPISPASRATSR
jgi:hypothetical protein